MIRLTRYSTRRRNTASHIHRQRCTFISCEAFYPVRRFSWRCSPTVQSKLVVLKSLAIFLQQALSVARGDSSSSSYSWYMSSAFASARAHRSFDALLEPSLTSGPSKVVWKPEAVPSEEKFVGTFPLVDAGVDTGFSLQELSGLQSATATDSSTRLKHISVCLPSRALTRAY